MPPEFSEAPEPQTEARHLPWGPISAITITLSVYFGSQFLAGFVISLYPVIKGWTNQQATNWLTQSVYGQFFFIVLAETITLWLLWWFLKHRRARPSQIGLKKPRLIDSIYALAGFGVYFGIYISALGLLQRLVPHLNTGQKQDLGFSTTTAGPALIAVFVSLVLLPPLVEEIVARGFLYTGLRSKLPKVAAAVITSLLFAAAHLQFGTGKTLLWAAAVDTFILSLVLVYLRDKTDRLWAPIMLHMLKNGIAFVSLFVLHLT
ncbi:CPBP family intramembrane metalloprotease [Candidatus Saccharibacteria bacterium]|nr:CPBP family intramembrane metalloprotease [Candidatus Saccharibacteria bacterium]